MTKYEFIKKLSNSGDLSTAIRMKVLNRSVKRHIKIYESFKSYRAKGHGKLLAYTHAAIDNGCCDHLVMGIVKEMDKAY